jgi:hypothetical protein
MAHTYTSLHYHVVFSTKNRHPFLGEAIRDRVFAYLGGIARENGMSALEIGGVADQCSFTPFNPCFSCGIESRPTPKRRFVALG